MHFMVDSPDLSSKNMDGRDKPGRDEEKLQGV
jgi:hypothetical protein